MKKRILGFAVASLLAISAHSQATVIQCDPNATGSSAYPNVSCDSSGNISVKVSGSTGTQQVVGAGANGAAVTGNPVLTAGSDGTNARTFATDSSGREIIVGAGASGATLVGNPVLTAGSDGTNARTISTDSGGNVKVTGASNNASVDASGNNLVKVGGWDGANTRTLRTDVVGAALVTTGISSSYNITAATVVKATKGTLVKVSVIVAGSAAGTVNDVATTGGAAVGNQIGTIPNTVGTYEFQWPCGTGIVVVPGSGQTLAVSYN